VSMASYAEVSLGGFLNALASEQPTPGGGAAAAAALAMGAAMVEMACAFSLGRKRYREVEAELRQLSGRCREIRARALELAEADAGAYATLARALQMSRDTEAQSGARRAAVATAAREATLVPLELAELCAELIRLSDECASKGNPNLIGDAAGAAAMARGAARVCQLNVKANLQAAGDQSFTEAVEQRMRAASASLALADRVVEKYL